MVNQELLDEISKAANAREMKHKNNDIPFTWIPGLTRKKATVIFLEKYTTLLKCYAILSDGCGSGFEISEEFTNVNPSIATQYTKKTVWLKQEFASRLKHYYKIIKAFTKALNWLKNVSLDEYHMVYHMYIESGKKITKKEAALKSGIADKHMYDKLYDRAINHLSDQIWLISDKDINLINSLYSKEKSERITFKAIFDQYETINNSKYHNTKLALTNLSNLINGNIYIDEDFLILPEELREQFSSLKNNEVENQIMAKRRDTYWMELLQILISISLLNKFDTTGEMYTAITDKYLFNLKPHIKRIYNADPDNYNKKLDKFLNEVMEIISIFLWGMPDIKSERLSSFASFIKPTRDIYG